MNKFRETLFILASIFAELVVSYERADKLAPCHMAEEKKSVSYKLS